MCKQLVKMLLLATLILFIQSATTNIVSQGLCKFTKIHNVNHKKVVLQTNVHHPSELSIDYDKNIIFYSYTQDDGSKTVLKTAYFDLKSLEVTEISEINNIVTSAIDNDNHKVYLGGKTGIYKFDYHTKKLLKFDVSDNIWQLFYKDGLYFTTYDPEEQSYYLLDNTVRKLTDGNNPRMRVLGIDNNSNIYFANSSGLFYKERSTGAAGLLIEDIVVNAFNSDKNGALYFSSPSSIYEINTKSKKVEKLLDLQVNSLWGFAIDENGNIIYGSEDSIIKLVPTFEICGDETNPPYIRV